MNHSEKHLEQFVEEIVRSLKPKLEDQALIECFLLFIHAKQTKSEFHRVEELGEFIKQLKIPLSLSAEPWLIEVWQEFSFKWDRFITMSNDFEIGLFLEYVLKEVRDLAGSNLLRTANFITPSEMVKLMVSTMANTKMQSIYDPACGSGDLLMTAGKELKAQNFFGETQSEMNLRMARLFGLIYKSQQPSAKVNFSDRPFDNKSYDAIISNPPFGLTIKDFSPIGKFNSEFKSGKSEVLFLNHILDSMSENGVASVILPLNALFGKGLMEKVRRRIIDDNLLEAVIQLPSKVFYNSNVSTVIFLLKKQKETEDILLIDLSKDFRKGKKRYEVKSEAIEKAIIAVQSFRNGNKEEKAMVVSPKMVIEKDYNLSLNLYQNSNSKDLPKFRSSEDLLEECKAIERRIGELQKRF